MSFEKLREAISDRNTSIRQVAHKANIATPDLYQAINGNRPFYPGWRRRVAEVLQMDESELFPEGDRDEE